MTTTSSPNTPTVTFEPPGPGQWQRDNSHATPAPTRLYRRLTASVMPEAYREVFAEFGGPIDTLDVRWVHGAMYTRIRPLVAPDSDRPPPPAPVMWMVLRLHPAFRRREKAARRMWRDRPDQQAIAEWYRSERQEWIDRNLSMQAVEPAGLDDRALADHLVELEAHLWAGWHRHHVLHGSDVGPIGDLLVRARDWGITPEEVLPVLHGASPATTRAMRTARRIADALTAAGSEAHDIVDLARVRAVPAAAELLDEYLAEAAWQVATSYDVEALTLGELPSVICGLIRTAANGDSIDDSTGRFAGTLEQLRVRVPADERTRFDELVELARTAYGLRDDNGPLTAEWPMGLVRRAVLEIGRRLHASGRITKERHVFELDLPEMVELLRGATIPTAAEIVTRAEERRAEALLEPPDLLGRDVPEPPLSVFPPGIRRTMDLVITAMSLLEADTGAATDPLDGLGIGDRAHRGRARVVADQDQVGEVFTLMKPGEVLVAPWTAPTFNPLFGVAGAVVVREGGPLCHAAVMARELGIPTVIGCKGALDAIADGDLVEVDPIAGRVTVVSRA